MFSKTTLASKESKRQKVIEIMQSCDISFGDKGLMVDNALATAAVLGGSGKKCPDQYLTEGPGSRVRRPRQAGGDGQESFEAR